MKRIDDRKQDNERQYCIFYIVRHGETEGNVKRILQGHSDFPLTEEGIKQAQKTAQILKQVKFDQAFSSDLLRARRTAEIIALEHKIIVKTSKLLRERSFGRLEGKSYEEYVNELVEIILQYEALSEKEKFSFKFREDIESDEEIIRRFITFLREVAVAYAGKTILIVSHGGMMRSLLIHLGFGTYKTLLPGAVKNLGYIKLESDGVDFFIKETEGIDNFRAI
ncbi:histidine phosphatase family protein [Candidatus Roizmanbacteria bacterium]|nr:histidine phosphatase family protein [Candidatus Roizmanbacteria bacterium]